MAAILHLRDTILDDIQKHLDVYIIVQIFVGVAKVVLIVRKFEYFASLAWKCLFMPNKWILGAFDQQNGMQCQRYAQKAHICVETSHVTCWSS